MLAVPFVGKDVADNVMGSLFGSLSFTLGSNVSGTPTATSTLSFIATGA